MQSNNIVEFPRQKEHYCTTGAWKLLKSRMKIDRTGYFACTHLDVELGDFLYVMGTDDVMHRTRVTQALELSAPIKAHNNPKEFWMVVTVILSDPKSLTEDCDIRII